MSQQTASHCRKANRDEIHNSNDGPMIYLDL